METNGVTDNPFRQPDKIYDLLSQNGIDWRHFLRICDVEEYLIENELHDSKDNRENCYQVLLKHTQEMIGDENVECFYDTLKEKFNMLVTGSPPLSQQKQYNSKLAMEKFTPKTLQVVANHVGPHWPKLARKLNCSSNVIECINEDFRKSIEKAFQCLYKIYCKNKHFRLGAILSAIQNDDTIPKSIYRNLIEKLREIIFPLEEDWVDIDNEHHFFITAYGNIKLLTHSSEREHHELEVAIKNLNHAKKNNLIVTVPSGKFKKRIKLSHFISESIKLIKSNFQENDCITYPSKSGNFTNFELYLKQNSPSALLHDYNIMKHYEFLGLKAHVTDCESESSHKIDHIGVVGKKMFFIKISKAKSLKQLKNDIDDCASFVRMFVVLLHLHNLTDQCLLPVIVIPNESEYLIEKISEICDHCKNFIVTNDKFQKFDTPLKDSLLGLTQDNKENEELNNITAERNSDKLRNALASIIGYMRICEKDSISKGIVVTSLRNHVEKIVMPAK